MFYSCTLLWLAYMFLHWPETILHELRLNSRFLLAFPPAFKIALLFDTIAIMLLATVRFPKSSLQYIDQTIPIYSVATFMIYNSRG